MAQPLTISFKPPERLGRWPAIVRFLGFTGLFLAIILTFIGVGPKLVAIIQDIFFRHLSMDAIYQIHLKSVLAVIGFITAIGICVICMAPMWLFLIIHLYLLIGYSVTAIVLSIVNWIYTLISGQRHEEISYYVSQYIEWTARLMAFIFGATDRVVNIDFYAEKDDDHPLMVKPGDMPLNIPIAWSRALIIPFIVFLIPHIVIFPIRVIVTMIAAYIRWIMIVFTGATIVGKDDNPYVVRFIRYISRIMAYAAGISDIYPSLLANT